MRALLKIFCVLLLFSLSLGATGSEVKKKPNFRKKKKMELVMDTTRLGKNKLFFSKKYQKKLKKRMKKKKKF